MQKIHLAIEKRKSLIQPPYNTAFRLLNGFLEGVPNLIVDVYGTTAVFHDYSPSHVPMRTQRMEESIQCVQRVLPWITTGIVKQRRSKNILSKNGRVVFGETPDKKILERGVWYAIELTLNRDCSFYLDTRYLREWAAETLSEKSVLNTFAYTGSIGVAALVGGASDVIHLDLNASFLTIAKRSAILNKKEVQKKHYQTGDFWSRVNQYKKMGTLFDCVILDPPVYAKTSKGIIDLAKNYKNIINKVRPVINDGGYLVTINNALFQSGKDHQDELKELCTDGYLSIEKIIAIPEDCIGYLDTARSMLPADPTPYTHATKITVLRVKRK